MGGLCFSSLFKMLDFSRIFRYFRDGGRGDNLPERFREMLPEKRASSLRQIIKEAYENKEKFSIDELAWQAKNEGWSPFEIEKLRAYSEFYSGESALAYHRIMQGQLAKTDYELFITACLHCYLYDRLAEGYALLQQFEPENAEGMDEEEFYAYAGYIAFSGGGTIEEALEYFDQGLRRGFEGLLLVVNANQAYFEAQRLEDLDRLNRLIHERHGNDQQAVFALAVNELARDYYAEGFRLAEARYGLPDIERAMNPSLLSKPRWAGESVQDKVFLVHGEQGLGDIVMMSRFFPDLCSCGAKVIVDCMDAAIPLLQYNFPDCLFLPKTDNSSDVEFDVWTGIMSLPYHFGTVANTVPKYSGYLSVPPEQATYWKKRVSELEIDRKVRVGIAWSGNPSHRGDKRRSIGFEKVVPFLLRNPEIRFFSLQTNAQETNVANLINLSEEIVTLADTAALISEMDLVITVDTSIVHLAGALGKTTWLLLPRRYEWRWSLEGERNNWYESVKVLRQIIKGDWNSLLYNVFNDRLPKFILN